MTDPKEVSTMPEMGAITDRQLLVDMAQKLTALGPAVNNIAQNQLDQGAELASLKSEVNALKGRVDRVSDRAREDQPSKHDLEAQAALAQEILAREALAKKVDTLDKKQDAQTAIMTKVESAVVTWWSSPAGKVVRYLAWGALLGWLAKNNIHIQGINP